MSVRLRLMRALVNEGLLIFSIEQAKSKAQEMGIRPDYVPEIMHYLKKEGWIRSIKRGMYAVTAESGFATPPHDYEVAMALVTPSAISHWTALHYHHLTQQIPRTVFAITPKGTYIPRSINPKLFRFIQIKRENYFGTCKIWIGEGRVQITDPERTLLDGLVMPHYCGGFGEVLNAFRMRDQELDLKRIVGYALRWGGPAVTRLGWVLEYLNYSEDFLDALDRDGHQSIWRLDALGPKSGPIHPRWRVRENIGLD